MPKSTLNIIVDSLPSEWEGGLLKTDFKQPLKFFKLLEDKRFTDQEKPGIALRIFFETFPEKLDDVFEFIGWYIRGGKEPGEDDGKKVFDYNIDSGRLYASFFSAYRINLRTEKLHWFEFLELFQGLPEDTVLMRVIDIRTKKPVKGDKEYNRALRKMQRDLALEDAPQSMASFFDGW